MLRVSGSMSNWGCRVRGSGSSPVNDFAAENDRGRLASVASPPKTLTVPENTYSDDIS